MLFHVQIEITLKPTVMDAQGTTIERALHKLGHENAQNVRIGKFITLEVDAACPKCARGTAESMCKELLANQIIEQFHVHVVEAEASTEGAVA